MAISEDTGNQPAAVHTSAGTPATTASFSPQAGTLLVAMIGVNGPSGSAITATISDSLAGSWTLLKRQNTASSMGGTAEVWCRYLSSAPGSMTVTGSWTGADTGANLVVRNLLGAASTQTGATAGNGGASVAPSASVTPTQIGSWIYGALLDWSAATVMTANANTTIIDQFNDSTNGDTYGGLKANAATVSLSPVTYGCTNANAAYNVAFAEILPAGATADPGPLPLMFTPSDDFLGGMIPWYGALDSDHSVIVVAQSASITFEDPSSSPKLMLALTSESGASVRGLGIDDPYASSPALLTPDDVTGGMPPWGGAVDSITTSDVSVQAGAASLSITAQAPSAGLSTLPATTSLTVAANAPTAAVGALPGAASVVVSGQAPTEGIQALPGAASVTLSGRSPTTGLSALPGTATMSESAQGPSAGLSALPATGSIALAAFAPTAAVGVLPGASSVTVSGRSPSAALAALPGTAPINIVAQSASVAGATIANAGTASITVGALGPLAGVGGLAGAASITATARTSSVALAAGAGSAAVTVSAVQATGQAVNPQAAAPTVVSGHEPYGALYGRQPTGLASSRDTGPISGRQPLSSTSGTESPTSIKGKES